MKKHFSRAAAVVGVHALLFGCTAAEAAEDRIKVEFVREEEIEEVESEPEIQEEPEEESRDLLQADLKQTTQTDESESAIPGFQEYYEEKLMEKEEEIEEEVIPDPPEFRVYISTDGICCKSQYDEYYKDGWIESELGKFYFNHYGKAVKGWQEIDGETYYFSERTSLMESGWIAREGSTWYLDEESGRMVSGFRTINDKTYYFSEEDGVMARGMVEIEDASYFFDPITGEQQIGACEWAKNSYYFSEDGKMLISDWVDDKYYGEDGVLDESKVPIAKLEPKLKKYLSDQDGDWSVYVKMLDTDEELVLENHPVTAASLIKLYAMGAIYQEIEEGKIKEDDVASTVNSMITVSSNDAFNTLISMAGLETVNKWCEENGFEETETHHSLEPSGNGNISDGFSGTNMTSVSDCGHILESIYDEECVSKKASDKMLTYLKDQQRVSKIPAGVPEGIETANKTGETDDETHDAAIVFSPNGDYILCVMGAIPGKAWNSNSVITDVSKMVYEYINP